MRSLLLRDEGQTEKGCRGGELLRLFYFLLHFSVRGSVCGLLLQPSAIQALVDTLITRKHAELSNLLEGFKWTYDKVRARMPLGSASRFPN